MKSTIMQVQIKDKKAAQITVVCLLISLVGIAIFLGVKLMEWKDYVSVEAIVLDIYTSEGTRAHPNDRHTEVRYLFRVNGQEYVASRVEKLQSQSHIGEVRMIRYNPENPEMLEEPWSRNGLIIILCGGTAILVLLIIGLKQNQR